MNYTEIKNFEVVLHPYSDKTDIVSLQFVINNRNFISYPYYVKNIETEIIEKFRKAINGKETTIDLRLNNEYYALLQIKKDCFIFDTINSIQQNEAGLPVTQELYQVFENNTVFRNSLRNFISNYK
jgi:hypothetical protein